MPITPTLGEDIDDISAPINSAPEMLQLARDRHEELVQVPCVARATFSPLELWSVLHTKLPDHFRMASMDTMTPRLASTLYYPRPVEELDPFLGGRSVEINQEETGALLVLGKLSLLKRNYRLAGERLELACRTNPRAVGGFYLRGYMA